MNEELVSEWVTKAEEDYKAVEELYYKSSSEFANTICFHSQQCAEKYLKALLVKCGIEPPWIHALESLLDVLAPRIPELEESRNMLAQLSPYATEYRYPGKMAEGKEAEACIEAIRQLRNKVRPLLRR